VHRHHLILLVLQLYLVLHHQLSVGFLLHGPKSFFFGLLLFHCYVVSQLLFSCCFNLLNLVWIQSFEVIRQISVIS
jgi:Zn-dependent protease with chaperone function